MSGSYSEEYQLKDAVAFIRRAWLWLISFGLLGLLVGGIYSTLRPQYYEASGQIELAKYQPYEIDPDIGIEKYVTDLNATVDLIRAADFLDGDNGEKCGFNTGGNRGSVISQRMRAFVVPNTPYIGVTVKAISEVAAKECIEAIFRKVEPLQLEHLRKRDAYTVKKIRELDNLFTERLDGVQKLKTTFGLIVIPIDPKNGSPLMQISTPTGPKLLYMDADADFVTAKRRLETWKRYLDTSELRKPKLSAVKVYRANSFPPTRILLLMGLAVGLGVGGLSFVIRSKILRPGV